MSSTKLLQFVASHADTIGKCPEAVRLIVSSGDRVSASEFINELVHTLMRDHRDVALQILGAATAIYPSRAIGDHEADSEAANQLEVKLAGNENVLLDVISLKDLFTKPGMKPFTWTSDEDKPKI